MKYFLHVALAFFSIGVIGPAYAQAWPTKPIRLIVPFSAGNVNDLAARIVAGKLSSKYGRPVIVENHPGAGGIIGMNQLLMSARDGHTFGFLPGSVVIITPLLYKSATFDVKRDLVPVAPIGEIPFVIAVHPDSGIASLDDLIQRAKASPVQLNFATQFIGSGAHLISMRILGAMDIVNKFTMIPYNGSSEAVVSVVRGETLVTLQSVAAMAGLIKSDKLRALAVTSKQRLAGWPNLPTVSERFPGSDGTGWFGIFALSGTPPEIVAKFSRDIDIVIRMPDVIKQFEVGGIYPIFGGQKELAEQIAVETPVFEKIVKGFNIKIE